MGHPAVLLALDHIPRPADLDASQVERRGQGTAQIIETPPESQGSHGRARM
jgi:hypothetical protein